MVVEVSVAVTVLILERQRARSGGFPLSAERVRVYDFETQKITTIPAAELASGMIKAQVQGIDGEVYVEASQVRLGGDYRHPPFDAERKALMRHLAEVFADVYPITAEQWEDGFRRD